jgi:hypothetical protein
MDYSKLNTLKLESYQKVSTVLLENKEMTTNISSFGTAMEQLEFNRKKLEDLHTLLGKEAGNLEVTKSNKRSDLVRKTLLVTTIMQIFAYDKKKKNLEEKLACLTPEYFQTCTDIQMINTSKKVWSIANKYGTYSLAYVNKMKTDLDADKSNAIIKLEKDYGLIPDMIKNIEEANIKFIETLLAYQDEMKEKEKIVNKLKKTYKQTENLLQNKIDRFVFLVANEHPDFYKEYMGARKIEILKDADQEEKSGEAEAFSEGNENAQTEVKQRSRPVKKAQA